MQPILLVSSLQTPLPMSTLRFSNSALFSPRHRHSVQYSVLALDPQQSPPSQLQARLLLISSQYPSAIQSRLQPPLPVVPEGVVVPPLPAPPPSRHRHSEQYCVSTQDPQQSPPSYLHSALFFSSLQNPFPTNEPLQP